MNKPRLTNGKSVDATERRLKARYLVVVERYSQKQASEEVGVSEKTISHWAQKGKWFGEKFSESIMQGFFILLFSKDPRLHKKVTELWNEYLQQLKNEFKEC